MIYLGPESDEGHPKSPKVNNAQLAFFGQLKRFHAVIEVVPYGSQARIGYRF
jgi:hypothetical protein